MRPALKAGLMPVWRDRDTVQIGIDPRRAVAITGMREAGFLVGLLDGSRDRDQVIETAVQHGLAAATAERVLTLLAAGGALDEPAAGRLAGLPRPMLTRMASELATAALADGSGDGGSGALARRQAAWVRIHGDRRIGRDIARILSSAGVRRLTRSANLGGGVSWAGAAGPGERRTGGEGRPPDLVILVGRVPLELAWELASCRISHLAVAAAEAIGVVGPLVIPGVTACLRCLEYARARADPAWPLILAQLARGQPDPQACDAALAAAVAAQAAAAALVAIDRGPAASAAAGGTLELVLPGWQWRRRTWNRHPACPCAGLAGQ